VFGKLLDHLSAGNGPRENLRSYLFEAAYHSIVDEARYARIRLPLEEVEMLPGDDLPSLNYMENRMLFEPVFQALQYDLTDYQRHVIILRFFEGFSLRETAEILGKSVNVIKAAQHHAITTLRKALDRQGMKLVFSSINMAIP
jgi:RNA polymerase sigma-70 factor (ECF subfamily)